MTDILSDILETKSQIHKGIDDGNKNEDFGLTGYDVK